MRIAALLLIVASAAGEAGAQLPGIPVPRGKDSAAVAAIFARHVKATGVVGRDLPRFMHVKQQMEMQGAPPVETEYYLVRPGPGSPRVRARSIMNMPMMGVMETVVNGNDGWVTSPSGPSTLLSPDQVKEVLQSGSPDPFMIMPQGALSLAPKATIDGREMDAVRFVDSLGTDAVLYFDIKTGLASAAKSGGSSRGVAQDTSMLMLIGDYKPFNGGMMPTKLEVRQGAMQTLTMRVTQMEFTPIDTMMFVPPAAVREMLRAKKP